MSILRNWWIKIRSIETRKRAVVEDRGVDLSREPNRDPRRNPGALPDRVAGDEAIHVPKIENQSRTLDRDRAVPNHHDPGAIVDLVVAGNHQVGPFPRGGAGRILDQSVRMDLDHAADRAPKNALDPDEDHDPKVAPDLVITRRDAAEDPLLALKLHERDHD